MHFLPRVRYALTPAAARSGKNDVDRGGVTQELRGYPTGGQARLPEEQASPPSARGTGWRRLLPQWRQALQLAERSRVADIESLCAWTDCEEWRVKGVGGGRRRRQKKRPPGVSPGLVRSVVLRTTP